MAAVTVWRYTSGRILGGWGPLLCVLVGSLVVLLMPLVGVENECCAALKGIAQLRCQLWGSAHQPPAVQSTSLTVPFTALDLLPHRSKPSKGNLTQSRGTDAPSSLLNSVPYVMLSQRQLPNIQSSQVIKYEDLCLEIWSHCFL